MTDVDILRQQLHKALVNATTWLTTEPALDLGEEAPDQEWTAHAVHTVQQLRVRAASAMINIAFVGGFSSGKSFLIGGLQHRLQYEPYPNDEGMISDYYRGILYSAPQETTACPTTVVPVGPDNDDDATGMGFLRVKFIGAEGWANIGNSQPPAVVAAYTTQLAEMMPNRLTATHRTLKVAEAEIQLSDAPLPAKLYDLPGHGSLNEAHDQISNRAWSEADCFVFTTQATHTVGRDEHDVITRLHNHHVNTGKRIIWVVTGIDRANDLNDSKVAAWKRTVDKNNAYLREHYPAPAGQLDTFFGPDGFIGVSPAWEAKGRWEQTEPGREATGSTLISASHMYQLRETINDLIESGTGRKHVGLIAREAFSLVSTRHTLLSELLKTARLPLEELSAERDSLAARRTQLLLETTSLREQLTASLRQHLRAVDGTFRGLPEFLHKELDEKIERADLTKDRDATNIYSEVTHLQRQWTSRHGPDAAWERESETFIANIETSVRVILGDTKPRDDFESVNARVNTDLLKLPPSAPYRSTPQDVMEQVSKVVGLATPLVSTIAVAAGFITGPVLAIPVAVTLGAGIVYSVIHRSKSKITALELLRRERIEQLDTDAKNFQAIFVLAASARGTEIIDRAIEILSERQHELSRQITLADRSLAAPDNERRQQLVERLTPYCRRGDELVAQLTHLMPG